MNMISYNLYRIAASMLTPSVQEAYAYLVQHPEEVKAVLRGLVQKSNIKTAAGDKYLALAAAALLLVLTNTGPKDSQAPGKALQTMQQSPQALQQQVQQVSQLDMSKVFEELIDEYRDDPRLIDVLQETLWSQQGPK